MKTILTYTLILTILFPAYIFASPNELCVEEGLQQRLIDEELLNEVMLIAEDGVVEQDELRNLFMLIEEKRSLIKPEFIDNIIEIMPYNPVPGSCVQAFYYTSQVIFYRGFLEWCLKIGNLDSCLFEITRTLFYISILCWYFFLDIDPRLKILLFLLDNLFSNPAYPLIGDTP